ISRLRCEELPCHGPALRSSPLRAYHRRFSLTPSASFILDTFNRIVTKRKCREVLSRHFEG
ncbi:MAG TPA: hypothetical protein VLH87_04400, partial [Pyrinomonadaceae bacterium]|nr:hypothetical protein [Pyrinomonadaceae bacterium]